MNPAGTDARNPAGAPARAVRSAMRIAAPEARGWSALLLSTLLLLLPPAARAIPAELPLRALAHQTWSRESGLPQNSVNDLAFDADGFLWLGTENGLARFDGSAFEVFRDKDVPALKSSFVSRLYRDRRDRLWIGTIKNLAVLENGVFHAMPAGAPEVGRVNGFAEDAEGALLVASDNGLFRVAGASLAAVPGWSGQASAALASPEGLWIGAIGRVSRLRGREHRELPLPTAFANAVITSLAWSDGALWLATTQGLLRLRGERFDPQPLEPGGIEPNIQSLAADGETGLWVGSDKTIYRLDRGRILERIGAQTPGVVPWPMSMKASARDLWLGSATEGLQHFWISGNQRISLADGLTDPVVWSYATDGTRLFVGTNAGVAVIENGRARPYIAREALPYPVAYSLLQDRDARLWVGTFAGLARFQPDGRADRTFAEFAGTGINGLVQDGTGAVWAATTNGLFRIDGDAVQAWGEARGLPAKGIRFLLFTHSGEFWVGAEDGLFQREGERFVPVSAPGLAGAFVTSILELDAQRLVVGTLDRGLFLRDAQDWRQWTPEQGLPSSSVYFLGTANAQLLVSSEDGVYRIPDAALSRAASESLPVEILVGNPGEHQGAARIRCCSGGGNGKGLLAADGLWLATSSGALRVAIDEPSLPPPQAHLVRVTHGHQTLALAAEMRLDEPARDAAIEYGAIDFRQTSALQFRYRLLGFDEGWVEAMDRRTAYYTNLPPGRFRFEVAARRPFEAWGPVTAVTVEVPRRFVESWLFRAICALLGLLLVALLVRSRLRHLQAQKLALEAVVAERTRALELANASLREMSVTDPLTGLHNRRFLEQTLPMLLAHLQRRRAESGQDLVIGVVVIDIDHFKRINDRFGHAVGDLVLQRAAAALRASVREGEFLLRWGGEEFLAVIDTVERARLDDIAHRLHRAIAQSCAGWDPGTGPEFGGITCSIGYAALPISRQAAEPVWSDAIQLADYALYSAKAAGRDCVMTIDPDTVPATLWRSTHAIDAGERSAGPPAAFVQ